MEAKCLSTKTHLRKKVLLLFDSAQNRAWIPTIRKHNNKKTVQQRTAKVTTTRRNNGTLEDRNALVTADLRDINGAA